MFGEQRVETTVDSQIACYYLEEYLQGNRSRPDWDSLIDELHAMNPKETSNPRFLRDLTRRHSADFASLYLARALRADRRNQEVQTLFEAELAKARKDLGNDTPRPFRYPQVVVLFVPGWDYETSGARTGSDYARPRELFTNRGLRNLLVKIDENGSVEANAEYIAREIRRFRSSEAERLVVVSASSAGPAVALALGRTLTDEEMPKVRAWLNICGILRGSPLVDHHMAWPRSCLLTLAALAKGWEMDAIESMSVRESRPRFDLLNIPDRILIVNYIGIPLSGHISDFAREGYLLMRDRGPNDGLMMATDAIAPNSRTIVAFGRDHFVNDDPEIAAKTLALVPTVLEMLRRQVR
jgi:hypothetical protein